MGQLTFSGRSDDHGRLVLVDETGQEHTLAVDPRLRKALRADGTGTDRTGQLEIPMESTIRPRDIQTRIRAGESPEAVAHAAGTSVEKIMPFAAPVLAERAHVAQRAQLSSVRRRTGESGARTLGEAVAAQLRAHNVDPTGVEWDAWRREDGRWTLTGEFSAGGRTGTGTFSFDTRGNFVTVDDEDGHWLVGDTAPATSDDGAAGADPAGDDLAAVRQRRLSAVPADELPLGEDAIEMVAGQEPAEDPAGEASASETTLDLDLRAERSGAGSSGGEPGGPSGQDAPAEDAVAADAPAQEASQDASQDPAEDGAESRGRKSSRRRGRASVPSWDEIMFGGGKGD